MKPIPNSKKPKVDFSKKKKKKTISHTYIVVVAVVMGSKSKPIQIWHIKARWLGTGGVSRKGRAL
jgi:hypothetical protein